MLVDVDDDDVDDDVAISVEVDWLFPLVMFLVG